MQLPTTMTDCSKAGDNGSAGRIDRFEYPTKSFWRRLLVGTELKTSLSKNRVEHIPYRRWSVVVLVTCLLLIGFTFTPNALPNEFGFEWATARDFCQDRNTKLDKLETTLSKLAKIREGRSFIAGLENEIRCVNESSELFYYGTKQDPERVLWPNGCTTDMVSESLTRKVCEPEVRYKKTVCVKMKGVQKALAWVARIDTCREEWVEPVCSTDVDKRAQTGLLAINEERQAARSRSELNETLHIVDYGATDNQKMKDIMSSVVSRVDIASNLYIFYTICILIYARPLIVCKRGKRTRILGATLGMGKTTFTLLVVVSMTLFDSISSLVQETDIKPLLTNFRKDPCWIDPEFSLSRGNLISKTCGQVTALHIGTSQSIRKLDDMYFKLKLFGLCAVNGTRSEHPALKQIGIRRDMYRTGLLQNPAVCNISRLNKETETPPDTNASATRLLESGVLAQLLAKIILSNLLIHIFSYIEPMSAYSGKVEVWGDEEMTETEKEAVVRFARDKHCLPCIIYILAAIPLIVLVIVSAAKSLEEPPEMSGGQFRDTNIVPENFILSKTSKTGLCHTI